MLWFMNLKLGEKRKYLMKMLLKLFTTFTVFERQCPPSWLNPNIGLLPEVIDPVSIQGV